MVAAAIPILQSVGSFALSNFMSIATLAMGAFSAVSTHNAGVAQQEQAFQSAAMMDQEAKQERAVSHYEMARQRQEQKARASENTLALASGGFSGDDPSSVHLLSEVAGQETLEQLMTKAQGEQRARNLEREAISTRAGGKIARKAATLSAFTQAVSAGSSWYDRYGPGRQRAPQPTTRIPPKKPMPVPTGGKVKSG